MSGGHPFSRAPQRKQTKKFAKQPQQYKRLCKSAHLSPMLLLAKISRFRQTAFNVIRAQKPPKLKFTASNKARQPIGATFHAKNAYIKTGVQSPVYLMLSKMHKFFVSHQTSFFIRLCLNFKHSAAFAERQSHINAFNLV